MRTPVYPQIKEYNGAYELITDYDAGFVAQLKAMIPASDRRFDPTRKSWLVSAQYGKTSADLIQRFFGIAPNFSSILSTTPEICLDILKILYIGQCKERADGSITALGYMNPGGWCVSFPEQVLLSWFGESEKVPAGNFFSILGIKTGATDDEVKAGYRRMVKQWHPDVCREPNATEIFHKIQKAYDALKDRNSRARYEAGLAFEASLKPLRDTEQFPGNKLSNYRAPLRNGLILAQYERGIGLMTVSEIKSWSDIVNECGQTLVSSWISGEKEPHLEWV